MPELLAALDVILAAARDWATLLFAVLAAGYGWKIDRDRRRDRAVLIDGFARRVAGKTLRIELDVRNRSRQAIKIERLAVLRPTPSILAMDGVHDPGPGPIACRHVIPAESRGSLAFLLGSPGPDGVIRVRCRFRPHLKPMAWPRRRVVSIEPEAVLAESADAANGDGMPEAASEESIGGHP
jgi:hypothetical protein